MDESVKDVWRGTLMNGPNDIPNEAQRPSEASYARFSRSAGVDHYRRKRFHGRAFKAFVTIVLLAILGGVGFLFSRQAFNAPLLPSDSTSGQTTEEALALVHPGMAAQPAQMNLVFAGDVIMTDPIIESGRLETGAFDYDHLFRHLTETLSSYDVRAVSQETCPPGWVNEFGMEYSSGAAQALGRAEADAGFNVILHASDHALDNGPDAIRPELEWWKNEYPSVAVLGMANPDPEANPELNDYVNNVYLFEKDGLKVAVLNHTIGVFEDQRAYLSALDEQKITHDVRQAHEAGANLIVACPHWGDEYSTEPSDYEMEMAQLYANLGVDVIVGTHPRVLQRVDVLEAEDGRRTVCFYSLGCLTSDLEGQNLLGGLAQVTLERYGDGSYGVSSATLKPVITRKGERENYTTYLLADYTDELAQTDGYYWLPTPEDAANICTDILGEGYDRDAAELRVSL